ncbi:MAG TPA: hypothetical protein PKK26_18480, partial [Candidatus Wallbacteria bacterium]|nr:hypothetical protein [Candidatus Wallbacteria bacterium]
RKRLNISRLHQGISDAYAKGFRIKTSTPAGRSGDRPHASRAGWKIDALVYKVFTDYYKV